MQHTTRLIRWARGPNKRGQVLQMTCCAPRIRQLRTSANRKSGVAQLFKPECATVVAESEAPGGPRRGESGTQASWLGIRRENAAFLVQ